MLAGVLVAVAGEGVAAADPARVQDAQIVSGPTPFPHGCNFPGEPTLNSEAEPSIAVNPRDARNVIAVWQQDRYKVDGGAQTNVVGVSRDGGRSFRRVLLPKVSRCTGGVDERTSDPWVSFGPDGVAYMATLTFTENPALGNAGLAGPTALITSRSIDGGLNWSDPVTVVNDNIYDDREAVTADPTRPGTAYITWVRRLGSFGENGVEYFSRTTDGGRSWSPGKPIYAPGVPGNFPDPDLISVLDDGTLVNVFVVYNVTPFLAGAPRTPFALMSMRSTDRGDTWSAPVKVADISPFLPADPDKQGEVRALPIAAVDPAPGRTMYVAWNEIPSEFAPARILLASSADGGLTWSPARTVARSPAQAFLPSLAVASDGTIGVTYDDFRNDRRGDNQLTTDVWFTHSHDGGRTWQETHAGGPFDVLGAAATSSTDFAGRFVGDYQGIAAMGHGFGAVFAQATPQAAVPPSDMFFTRVVLGESPLYELTVRVTPRRVRVGRRVRLSFRVTTRVGGRDQPVKSVLIRVAGRRGKTDRRGRTRLTLRFRRNAVYRVTASRANYRTGYALVRAGRGTRRAFVAGERGRPGGLPDSARTVDTR
jgi:hypothetical protein